MNEGRIAAGFYKGHAIEGSEQFAVNERNGNEQIAIDLDVPSLGRQFTTFLHFSEAAAPYAIERLRACGWTGDDVSNLAGIGKNEIDVQIKYETYDGKERMKVDIATGGGRVKLENQMNPAQKRQFAARMKAVLKSSGGGAATAQNGNGKRPPAPPAGGGGGAVEGEDEIPFALAGDAPERLPRWERW